MSSNDPRPTTDELCDQNGVTIRSHSEDRWTQRTEGAASLAEAWTGGYTVETEVSWATGARLYPPYDALLIVEEGVLTTIMNNDEDRTTAPRLTECSACGNQNDPLEDDTCRWCDAEEPIQSEHGAVSITRGDN